ncbi:MAG: hypothetical protein ACFFDN_07295 [Candidatus Hodarchaeota archaeon]
MSTIYKGKGFYYSGNLTWDKKELKNAIKAKIILTNEDLTIIPKDKKLEQIIIPIEQIVEFKIHTNFTNLHIHLGITLKDDLKYFFFFSNRKFVPFSLVGTLTELIEKPKMEKQQIDLKEGLKAIKNLSDTVFLKIPPQTKLKMLKCPGCQAPLEYMPPCKCEHCGARIELEY